VLVIQDACQITGSTNISETMTFTIKIPSANRRHSTTANSQEVYLGDSNNERQLEMAAETGNTYISETMWGAIKIPKTNLRFKTNFNVHVENSVGKWLQQRPASGNIDDMAPKTGNNYIAGTLTDSVEIATPNSGFSMMTSSIKD